jgi:hypothetical protein
MVQQLTCFIDYNLKGCGEEGNSKIRTTGRKIAGREGDVA